MLAAALLVAFLLLCSHRSLSNRDRRAEPHEERADGHADDDDDPDDDADDDDTEDDEEEMDEPSIGFYLVDHIAAKDENDDDDDDFLRVLTIPEH